MIRAVLWRCGRVVAAVRLWVSGCVQYSYDVMT